MNTHMQIAAQLLRDGPPVVVDDDNYPVGWTYAEGMADFICLQVGLPRETVGPYLVRLMLMHSHNKVARPIAEDQRVLVCLGPECETLADLYIDGVGSVCHDHLTWTPPPAVCACDAAFHATRRGDHHHIECPMWLPPADAVGKWIEEAGAKE